MLKTTDGPPCKKSKNFKPSPPGREILFRNEFRDYAKKKKLTLDDVPEMPGRPFVHFYTEIHKFEGFFFFPPGDHF